ncbi:unnamed protein product [Heterobilharzia americana]|nr:unnamed protein product [Heterobilharzia americana]
MTSVQSTSQSEEKIKLLNACHRGDLDYLGKFIVDGGNLRNMIDNQTGYTPLHYCVKWIEGKADCTKEDHNDNKVDDDANVFKQYDRLKCTRVIIKSNPEFLNYFDHNGFTPIHLAVINGDVDFLKVLSEFTNVNMKIKTKAKSLLLSTSSSSEPSEFSELNNTGRTVLHLCVIYTQIEVLTYFLTNINNIFKEMINEHDDQGATALHYSVQVNPEQIDQLFELLISIGGANLNSCDTHGRTPLIWAATVGSKHAVESLLKMGANLNHRDTHGLTALHCAASRGHLQTVQSILNWIYLANRDDESKVGVFRDVIDNDGCSPLFYSVATGHVKVTECLIKAGTNVMHVDHKGRTVCHCLARLSSLSNGIKSEKLIKTQLDDLMKAGLDPWKANNNAATPLHEACLLRNVYFIKQLANLPGFDEVVNAKESQGHSPLHLVVAASWSAEPSGIRLCQFLLEHGADVNSVTSLPNKEHVTPLNLAYLNETSDEKSKEALIDLLKHYGGRTYQELIDEGRVCADQDVDTINTVSNEAQFYDDHNNDKPDSSLVSDYVACPEKELKLINESQKLVLIKEEVETTVKTLPHKTDSATEPIAPPSLGLALKDSSVQTCSDNRRRRKKRLSTSSSTTISSEKLKQEPVSTVSCYTQTDRHFYKSSKDSTSGSSSPNNPVEDNEDNVFRNNDNSHHDKNSLQQLVVRMPTPSDLKVQNQNSSAADRIRTAMIAITISA